MARITIAMLSAQLAASQAECAALRQINSDWAHQARVDRAVIARLKAQVPAQAPNSNPRMDDARGARQSALDKFFAAHPGRKSASVAELREFMRV